jgi:hypothetical protein
MPHSSAITSALIAKLLARPTLMTLTPDGVFFNIAGASMATGGPCTRFVIVSLVLSLDEWTFPRRAFEDALYLVEARVLSTSGGNAHAAAAEIDAELDPQPPDPPATLTVPGYGLMGMAREEATEAIEFDDVDPSIQWTRCGGRYRVQCAVVAS